MLDIDKENRRLSLGHKQLEENPWDVFETIFKVGSIHEGTIIEKLDKGAIVSLPYGVEGFATPKHLQKEDGSQAKQGETLQFKVIEFAKETRRIILSHSRTFEDVKDDVVKTHRHAPRKQNETAAINNVAAGTSLGDLDVLAKLKADLDKNK